MYIIVGLGNPGRRYEHTRHNIGFITVDYLAEKHGIRINKIKHKALVGEGMISQKVAGTQTYRPIGQCRICHFITEIANLSSFEMWICHGRLRTAFPAAQGLKRIALYHL